MLSLTDKGSGTYKDRRSYNKDQGIQVLITCQSESSILFLLCSLPPANGGDGGGRYVTTQYPNAYSYALWYILQVTPSVWERLGVAPQHPKVCLNETVDLLLLILIILTRPAEEVIGVREDLLEVSKLGSARDACREVPAGS